MTNEEFIKKCESAASRVLTAWANNVQVVHEYGDHYKLYAKHSWVTAYCDWSDEKENLVRALREVGAVNVRGKVEWDYVELKFDKSKRL